MIALLSIRGSSSMSPSLPMIWNIYFSRAKFRVSFSKELARKVLCVEYSL